MSLLYRISIIIVLSNFDTLCCELFETQWGNVAFVSRLLGHSFIYLARFKLKDILHATITKSIECVIYDNGTKHYFFSLTWHEK